MSADSVLTLQVLRACLISSFFQVQTMRTWLDNLKIWKNMDEFDTRFKRMWEYYLSCCTAAFEKRRMFGLLLLSSSCLITARLVKSGRFRQACAYGMSFLPHAFRRIKVWQFVYTKQLSTRRHPRASWPLLPFDVFWCRFCTGKKPTQCMNNLTSLNLSLVP